MGDFNPNDNDDLTDVTQHGTGASVGSSGSGSGKRVIPNEHNTGTGSDVVLGNDEDNSSSNNTGFFSWIRNIFNRNNS